jgi:TRAP transporter TAXI family solute receptor
VALLSHKSCGDAGCVLRTKSFILGLALIGLCAATPKAKAEIAWLGLVAGPPAGSETVLAADMASLFEKDEGFHVLPMLGDAGAGNIALLLNDPRVDIAFVSTDALAAGKAAGQTLSERLELVARLAPQEIHVLARAEIGGLSDLAGKKVNFGPEGGSSAATAGMLFKALGITVEGQSLDAGAAVERLKQGTIAAAVIVGGKPYPLVSAVPANSGIHLLPIPFGASLAAAYLPTSFEQGDYPNLIQPGGEVATVATGMVLLAAISKSDPGASGRVAHFVEALFPRFPELQASDRHPKWREVNLAASLPGFQRTAAAEAWLGGRPAEAPAKPIMATAGAVQPASMPEGLMSKSDKEALFKRFIEWQRSKGH